MTAPNQQPPGPRPTEPDPPSDSRTRIIRRAPTGPIPTTPDSPTTHIPRPTTPAPASSAPRPGRPRYGAATALEPSDRTAVAACAVSIISGWATSVVATDLIAGWWRTDRLFCIAIAFLALVFAATTVSGVIMVLQRRPFGRQLIVAGAVVAVLTYGGVFIAGARVAWIVHALPLLPIASVVLALHPRTKRWLGG
ncbi:MULTISPECIES: hypothetical protein [unclassified Mycobacterium]|uniref:hypothetical protein n=1 Tax=unclassified Mycobacterium TaxID=2642494 RepID=UPI0007FD1517|nr:MULTISPECIES: hypothetical protein [unclassified Mycobacterium]OBG75497.1 hypothetical protein A5700_24660 [Mycobacterium sp. E1214]OBH31326.1 hypothetical protein A5693_16765 [Mycobacterium sp. E1319]